MCSSDLAVSLTLFGINLFFNYQHEQELIEWQKQKRAYDEKHRQELAIEVERRTVSLAKLPLTQVYADTQNTQTLGQGVISEDFLIMFPSEELSLYNEVYTSPRAESIPYQQVSKSPTNAWPTLFSRNTDAKLTMNTLEGGKTYDLQFLSKGEKKPTQVVLDRKSNV